MVKALTVDLVSYSLKRTERRCLESVSGVVSDMNVG
jgi:hypothetical protein